MLLDAGASVDARSMRRDEYLYRSETALDIAVRTGNIGAVELLLQYGANRLCCAHSVETVPENVRRACLQAGIDLNGSDLNGSDLNGIELNGIDRNEGREVGIFF
jgi:ankyrin repeat protein